MTFVCSMFLSRLPRVPCRQLCLVLTGTLLALVAALPTGLLSAEGSAEKAPFRLLLLGQSPDGHPAGTHEYLPGMKQIQKLLQRESNIEIQIVNADEPWEEGPELLKKADGVVVFLSQGAAWLNSNDARRKAFQDLAARGGAVSVLHWGMGTREAKDIEPFVAIFGACHGGPDRKYKFLETDVAVADHPIAAGIEDFRLNEEFYYALKTAKDAEHLQPVLKAQIDGNWEMVSWAWQRADGGRAFGFSGLHFDKNWERPEYQRLVKQGILWTLKRLPAGS